MDEWERPVWSYSAKENDRIRFPRDRRSKPEKWIDPRNKDLVEKCLDSYSFRNFMEHRGFKLGVYQYKVLSSWRDKVDEYFKLPLAQHEKDYRIYQAERVRKEHADQLEKLRGRMADFAASTELPTKLEPPTSEIQNHDSIKPVSFDLLIALLPDYGNGMLEAAYIPSTSLYSELLGPDWIRLLILEPKSAGCRYHLKSTRIEDARGGYDALSYCWGDTEKSNESEVICNGIRVRIGKNLVRALKNLQFRALPRIIWVDALCINQEDSQERSSQVRLMGKIYSQASRTIMFLGDIEQSDSLAAFDLICRLVNGWDQNKPASYREERAGRWLRRAPPGSTGYISDIEKLAPIFNAEWFERRWVIQEAVLSSHAEVLVPGATINWKWIGIAAAILRANHDYSLHRLSTSGQFKAQKNVYNAYLMARLSNHTGLVPVRVSFLVLLRLAAGFQTTKDLDIVYGLLGLSCQDESHPEPLISADYSSSYFELMKRLVEKLMTLPEPLAFLSDSIGAWQQRSSDTPSWMPTWAVKDYSMLDPWGIDQGKSAFSPARGLPFKSWAFDDNLSLVLDGIHLSDVRWVSSSFSEKSSFDRAMREILFLARNFRPTADIRECESVFSLSRTMTGGRDGMGNPELNKVRFCGGFVDLLRTWHRCYDGDIPEMPACYTHRLGWNDGSSYASWFDFVDVAKVVCGRRRLFLTSHGHIGLGPETMIEKDVVCIFGGATMPHILRKVQNHYELVGDCFVDDIMEGEAVDAMQKKAIHLGPILMESFLRDISSTYLPRPSPSRTLVDRHLNSLHISEPSLHRPLTVTQFTIR